MQHYFINQVLSVKQKVDLPKDISHHLIKVLRAGIGDQFQVVSADQQVYLAEVIKITGQHASATILRPLNMNVELPLKVTIVSGLSKKNKPDLIVQKATELGASQIIFLPMTRSIVKWDQKSGKKLRRLNEIAKSAAEQSHRNMVPKVRYLNRLSELTKSAYDVKLVAYEEAAKQGEQTQLYRSLTAAGRGDDLVAVFGPEGGISPDEMAYLADHDFQAAGLGPRILRTETAPLYFLSAVSVLTELS